MYEEADRRKQQETAIHVAARQPCSRVQASNEFRQGDCDLVFAGPAGIKVVLAQQFAKQVPRDGEGAIVNLLDQRLLRPAPDFLSYGVSRAGLHWLTITLAQALAPRIRVNAVAPGPTLKAARQSQAHFEQERRSTILGHGSEPQDICDAIRYLLDAKAVTGQTIAVDGGQHLIWKAADVSESSA